MNLLTPEQKIDEIVGTFIALKYDDTTDEYSDGTLERWNNMKQAILSLLEEEKEISKLEGGMHELVGISSRNMDNFEKMKTNSAIVKSMTLNERYVELYDRLQALKQKEN